MKRLFNFFLIGILALSLVGCDAEPKKPVDEKTPQEENLDQENKEPEIENNVDGEDEDIEQHGSKIEKEVEVVLYYSNDKYIETGNDDLERVLPFKKKIKVVDGKIAEGIILNLYEDPKEEGMSTSIDKDIKFIDVKMDEATALVNFDSENLNGGSLQEDLVISQIVNSLLELDSVKAVKFLVNGEPTESLMGHFDTSEAFTEKIE